MGQKVYLVTYGSYSDYCIDKIFLSKEKAETYYNLIKNTTYDVNDIEEFDLSDDEVFTPYYYIEFKYYISGMEDKYCRSSHPINMPHLFGGQYYINVYQCLDNSSYATKRWSNYANGIITLKRPIGTSKDKIDIDYLTDKYLKVCYDLAAEIRYHLFMGEREWDISRGGLFDEINSMHFESEAE